MSKQVHILYDEAVCTVVGAFPQLLEELHYVHRDFDNESKQTEERLVRLYHDIQGPEGKHTIQTYQGLRQLVKETCAAHGYAVKEFDTRQPFPEPKLHLMHGFRFSQQQLLTDGLLKNESGLIGAPTRFGKSTLICNTLRAYPGVKTVVTAPGVDLLKQLAEDLKAKLKDRDIKCIFTGAGNHEQSEDITVVSMDSLEKCDFLGTKLVLIDEPHSGVTESRGRFLNSFVNARRIGFGATLDGRYDRADILIQAIIGPVLSNRTYLEAVKEGAVAPIEVALLKLRFPAFKEKDRDRAYQKLVWLQPSFHQLVAKICREAFPPQWQTLIFIKNEKQANGIHEQIPEGTIAMAKVLKPAERRELFRLMAEDLVKRCICSEIYSTGVTFHEVRALINAGGGGANIGCIQKPGRLAEIRPGKKCGVVVDFLWEADDPDMLEDRLPSLCAWTAVVRDSRARRDIYKKKGYNVTVHESIESIAELVRRSI